MMVVRIDSTRGSYSIVKARSLKTILNYVAKAYSNWDLDKIKVIHNPTKQDLATALDLDSIYNIGE